MWDLMVCLPKPPGAVHYMNSQPFPRIVLALTILLLSNLACNAVTDIFKDAPEPYIPEAPVPKETEASPPVEMPPQDTSQTEALFCPAVTDKILEVATQFYEDDTGEESGDEPEQLYLVTYIVSGNQISNHRRLTATVRALHCGATARHKRINNLSLF